MAPLLIAVAHTRTVSGWRGAFAMGLITGVVYFGSTVYWVAEVMRLHGGLPPVVAVLVAALLVSYLAIYPALFAALLGRAVHRLGPNALWGAPFLWLSTEWLRGIVGGGFPWVPLGASQAAALPVVQLASVVGVSGLSLLLALVSTTAAALALRLKGARLTASAVALLLAVIVAWGSWRIGQGTLTQGEITTVGLVQGNVAQEQKYDPRYRNQILNRYVELSRQTLNQGADLVVWPEASTPFYFDVDSRLAQPIRDMAASANVPFLLGTDEYEPAKDGAPERFYNAAVLVGRDGRSRGSYRKMQLVPFGEYVPLRRLLFFVEPLVEAVSDFSAGTEPVVFDADGARFSVSICYESVFPALSRSFVAGGSQLLVTITNDAWFGRSAAPYQHFAQGAIRAVEQGRYVVRAANTGISGAVDPYGRVVAASGLFEPAALAVDVRLRSDRTIYSRVGDVAVWSALAISLLLVLLTFRSSNEPR